MSGGKIRLDKWLWHARFCKTRSLAAKLCEDGIRIDGAQAGDGAAELRAADLERVALEDPGELLPNVHRVASLTKRWLLGTHQGSVDEAHLPAYLNEFVFRFNRRRSRSRGLVFYRVLELAAGHAVEMPITEVVWAVLHDGLEVGKAAVLLASRSAKPERYGI